MKNILMITLLAASALSLAAQPNANEIMKKSRDQAKVSGLESRTKLEIHDGKGNTRVRETTMASRTFPDGTEKRVIVFLAPADVKGTSMLIFDYDKKEDDMWVYMPALRKSRKIVSSEKTKSFMGSEFSNSDLAVGNIDDFTYTLDGTESVDQQECWKIIMLPANPQIAADYGISSKVTWIGKKDYITRKVVFLDAANAPFKEMYFTGIKLLDLATQKYFVTHMVIKNLKNNRFSVMNMDQISLNSAVKEEFFTLSFIEKQ